MTIRERKGIILGKSVQKMVYKVGVCILIEEQNGIIFVLNSYSHSLENIIIIYKAIELTKMSYMTVMPNYFYNTTNPMGQVPNQYMLSQNRLNTNTVLTHLQSALRISLNNYQLNYQQTSIPSQAINKSQISSKLTQEQIPNTIELIQSHEENKPTLKNNNHSQPKTTDPSITIIEEKEAKKDPQTLTDDEFLLEDREKNLKKNQLSQRKGKKVKLNPIDNFIVPIPQIDLIETAYIPTFTLDFATISKKRQDLLKRQVQQCGDYMKSKKDKRQIRNLTN